eukprot:COSAG02_NODE_2067_length_9945_cov_24.620150_8_plen_206_part_00
MYVLQEYIRPQGAAPKGATWSAKRGCWVLENGTTRPPKKKPALVVKTEVAADETAILEAILGVRESRTKGFGWHLEYQVLWEGGQKTWVAEECFADDRSIIQDLVKRFDFSAAATDATAANDLANLTGIRAPAPTPAGVTSYAEIGRAADAQIASLQKELAVRKRAKSSVKPVIASIDGLFVAVKKLQPADQKKLTRKLMDDVFS